MAVRKNQANLTAQEKRDFVNAILTLKQQGGYDPFVTTHNQFIMSDTDTTERTGHRSPSFLPWHRKFLIEFEKALQAITPTVTLPYWDWTTDRTPDASLWGPDLLGGDGTGTDGQVATGPFAYGAGNWTLTVRPDSRPYLVRTLAADTPDLPTKADVDTALAVTPYDAAPWNSSSAGFRNNLEGWTGVNIHNRVHVWVGGAMGTGMSPNDPVFWLHHCMIDRLWAGWQSRHPDQGYLPATATQNLVSLNDTMKPWNTTAPAALLDHTPFYTYDVAY
ncbi:tyrosinase MelC2 [Kitasatospora kifunensis]|uniref:Tyrosinase n=1 Tax=Kitasatospora kifunensis TaxID=58351 RepID=A0A7W7QZM1_KITKI|nr:tyrosinase family protein [Kitasatospora kifunensis]MBB4922475.1 tyrosinase [Kitasatospora kifunensis]